MKTLKSNKKTEILKLIDGSFSPEESKEILMSVFLSKLQFHKVKNFNSQETSGKSDIVASKRINEIRKSIDKLLKLIASAEKRNSKLEIKSEVFIRLVKNK